MKCEVFSLHDDQWTNALKNIPPENYDINFLPDWHRTWIEYEEAEPVCLYLIIEGIHFLYPFLKKRVPYGVSGAEFYDVQSAYGYGGIIASESKLSEKIIYRLNEVIDKWLTSNNVIAEFIRIHPLFSYCLRNAELIRVRRNVYVDQFDNYFIPSKQARQNISKAVSSGLAIEYDDQFEHLDKFIKLYNITAARLEMNSYYRFTESYFNAVKRHLLIHSTLIHIKHENEFIAGGLYQHLNSTANIHLAGSNFAYQHLRPNDLLFKASIELSIKNGVKSLCLGGGTSNDSNDSLFRFKAKYGTNIKEVLIGKKIHNPIVFQRAISEWKERYPELAIKHKGYFLKYRLKD